MIGKAIIHIWNANESNIWSGVTVKLTEFSIDELPRRQESINVWLFYFLFSKRADIIRYAFCISLLDLIKENSDIKTASIISFFRAYNYSLARHFFCNIFPIFS